MIRRDFLRRLVIGTAGLLVADDALELLTHKKNWPGTTFGISETTYPQWIPHRLPAEDFTHEELKEYFDALENERERIRQRVFSQFGVPEPLLHGKLIFANDMTYR